MPADTTLLTGCDDRAGVSGPRGRPGERVVMVVGPSPCAIGGMAGVVKLMGTIQFPPRWRPAFFTTTASPGGREGFVGRLARHIGHLRLLRKTLRASGASIVHIHTCSGVSFFRSAADMLAAQRLGCRVILHVHGASFDEFFERAGTAGRLTIRWVLTRADCVVALSSWWERKLLSMAPKARPAVVENACQVPDDPAVRNHHGPCRLLLLAKMDQWKGIDDLLEACRQMQKAGETFELILAGPAGSAGDARILNEKIRAKRVESSVRYVGPVLGKEKHRLFHWADVYVQPSHAEGMPLALLEAMAYRLPIVSTTVGAVPEVVRHGAGGLLVPPHEPDRLAQALAQLISDPKLRLGMGAASGELAATRFSANRFRDDLIALYDNLSRREQPVARSGAVHRLITSKPSIRPAPKASG